MTSETDAGVSVTAGSLVQIHDETTTAATVKGQDTVTRPVGQGSWIADGSCPARRSRCRAGANNGTYEVAWATTRSSC